MKLLRKLNKSVPKRKSWVDSKIWGQIPTEFDLPEVIDAGHSLASIIFNLDQKSRKRKSKRNSITLQLYDLPYDLPIKE